MNKGSVNDGELTFLDALNILSFLIGLQNLDMNVTQTDAQNLQHNLDNNTQIILNEIHQHLENQDRKLDYIIKRLEEIDNDKSS